MKRIDHVVWAAPNLEQAVDLLEQHTGVRAAPGSSHPGEGTRNAILGLGPDAYLEVLAPDPAQAKLAGAAAALAKLERPTLRTFAVAADRLDLIGVELEKSGLPHAGVIPMSRRLASGQLVRWRLLVPTGHAYGGLVPFFVDWGEAPHPSQGAEGTCSLAGLTITHPQAWSLRPLLERLEVDVAVEAGAAALTAELITPNGLVRLSSQEISSACGTA